MVAGFTVNAVELMSDAWNMGMVGAEFVIDFCLEFIKGQ